MEIDLIIPQSLGGPPPGEFAEKTWHDMIEPMIDTIEIVREQRDAQQTVYRAMRGEQQAAGSTPGQALDTLERMLAVRGKEGGKGTLVIVQRFRPDAFFTAEQQARLQALMSRFHATHETGQELGPKEKQELERLVDAESQAAIERGAAILRAQHSTA